MNQEQYVSAKNCLDGNNDFKTWRGIIQGKHFEWQFPFLEHKHYPILVFKENGEYKLYVLQEKNCSLDFGHWYKKASDSNLFFDDREQNICAIQNKHKSFDIYSFQSSNNYSLKTLFDQFVLNF